MAVDLLLLTHNRLEFTRECLRCLEMNTNWDLIRRVLVVDDVSVDGTWEFLSDRMGSLPVDVWMTRGRKLGPVSGMIDALVHSDADVLAKIDNDVVVCPEWLERMLEVFQSGRLDALGMEPGFAPPMASYRKRRTWKPARWIGGVGLIRTEKLRRYPMHPEQRWWGWTQFQRLHMRCGWIRPDLPVFLLDHLDFEPWCSFTDEYCKRGWSRRWPRYGPEMSGYYQWWLDERTREVA